MSDTEAVAPEPRPRLYRVLSREAVHEMQARGYVSNIYELLESHEALRDQVERYRKVVYALRTKEAS